CRSCGACAVFEKGGTELTIFSLKEAEVASHVRAVAGDDLDRDGIIERFACAAWSGLAEPGDGVAGGLVAALGAARALEAIIERHSAESIAAEVGDVEVSRVQQGIERWTPRLASATALLSLRQAARF